MHVYWNSVLGNTTHFCVVWTLKSNPQWNTTCSLPPPLTIQCPLATTNSPLSSCSSSWFVMCALCCEFVRGNGIRFATLPRISSPFNVPPVALIDVIQLPLTFVHSTHHYDWWPSHIRIKMYMAHKFWVGRYKLSQFNLLAIGTLAQGLCHCPSLDEFPTTAVGSHRLCGVGRRLRCCLVSAILFCHFRRCCCWCWLRLYMYVRSVIVVSLNLPMPRFFFCCSLCRATGGVLCRVLSLSPSRDPHAL